MKRRGLLAAAGVTFVSWSGASDAAELDRFEVADRGSRFFAADSLELTPPGQKLALATGVVSTYEHALRAFGTKQEGASTTLVSDQLALHAGAAVVLAPGVRFALDMPFYLQEGKQQALAGIVYAAPRSPVLGDARISVDLKLLGPAEGRRDGVTLAGGVWIWLPTGSQDDYVSDGYARVGLRLAASARTGHILAAGRIGVAYRRDDIDPLGGIAMGSDLSAVAAVGWVEGALTVGPELHAITILRDEPFASRTTPIDGVLGAHLGVADFLVGAGVGTAIEKGIGAPGFRGLVSVEWIPKPVAPTADRDRDGVPDGEDVCPDVPGRADGPPDARGCPDAPRDADRDGVPDAEDACPDLPGVRTRDPMTNGCPDRDRDGVPDPIDACPDVAGERSDVPRFNGCVADADGDGVPDAFDVCPDQPGPASNDREKNGCPPPPPDRDEDGVADDADACPDDAGPPREDPSRNGCPAVRRAGDVVVMLEPIAIERGKVTSDASIAALAAWLVLHADVTKLRIEAKTQADAQAIVDKLAERGVARGRLEARAAGDVIVLRVVR